MVSPNPNTPEPMKYVMLGEDKSTAEEKLEAYTGMVNWKYLRPHFLNGVLFFVDQELTLPEVGYAISENHTERVEGWLKSRDLVKIEEIHAAQWEGKETEFEALVVSPFVLCRPV